MTTKRRKFNTVEEMVDSLIDDKAEAERIKDNLKKRTCIDMLIAMRVKAKVSQTKLAKFLGITRSEINKIEHSDDMTLTLNVIDAYMKLTNRKCSITFTDKESG